MNGYVWPFLRGFRAVLVTTTCVWVKRSFLADTGTGIREQLAGRIKLGGQGLCLKNGGCLTCASAHTWQIGFLNQTLCES